MVNGVSISTIRELKRFDLISGHLFFITIKILYHIETFDTIV